MNCLELNVWSCRRGCLYRSVKLGAFALQSWIHGAVPNAAADGLTEIFPVS